MSRRVGTLNNARLYYGCRSLSVYETRNGCLHFKLDGKREKLHGNHRWTTLTGRQMKGSSTFTEAEEGGQWSEASSESDDSMSREDLEREEQRQIDLAIAASLEDGGGAMDQDVPAADPADQDAPPAAAVAPAAAGDASARTCVICLTDGVADSLMRPCNHLCACQGCARRLVNRPCPICRRHVRSVERVFF